MKSDHILSWGPDTTAICRTIRKRHAPFKIVLKTRNERLFLQRWITHHANIVGPENLIILDNNSDDPEVNAQLDKAAKDSTVFRFSGFHNRIHSLKKFHFFYKAVRKSSDYMLFLDTDEYLTWSDSSETYLDGSKIVDIIQNITTTEPIIGVWANNVRGLDDRFTLLDEKTGLPAGLTKGKSIIPANRDLRGTLCHNYHFDQLEPKNIVAGNAVILHMKNLSTEQRIRVNIEKLRQYKVIEPEDGINAVLAIDVAQRPRGNGREYISEIQMLHAGKADAVAKDSPIASGDVRLSGGKILFHSVAEQEQYARFISLPGECVAEALTNASRNPNSQWSRLIMQQQNMQVSENCPIIIDAASPVENSTMNQHENIIMVPEFPHMPAEAVSYLDKKLTTSKCYLEYGSGGSTRLAARHKVEDIYSVESDAQFGNAVKLHIDAEASSVNFTLLIPDIGPTGDWGFPVDENGAIKWPYYCSKIWENIRNDGKNPDLILIDGRFRVACFLYSLLASSPGTTIIFDDYRGRKDRYGVVEKYIKLKTLAGRAAVFEVPDSFDKKGAALELINYVMDPR